MICENCHCVTHQVYEDKVNHKLVCFKCVEFALDSGIRVHYDFVYFDLEKESDTGEV
jgi:hypothetical protein